MLLINFNHKIEVSRDLRISFLYKSPQYTLKYSKIAGFFRKIKESIEDFRVSFDLPADYQPYRPRTNKTKRIMAAIPTLTMFSSSVAHCVISNQRNIPNEPATLGGVSFQRTLIITPNSIFGKMAVLQEKTERINEEFANKYKVSLTRKRKAKPLMLAKPLEK